MATLAKKRVGWLSGNPQDTAISFVVASFTDAAILVEAFTTETRTGSPVASRTINASAGASPKLAKYANDRGSADPAGETWACWVGSSTLTGLTAGTRYYVKITQSGVAESDAETWTRPAAGSDFNVFVVSCDISFRTLNDPTHDPGPGIWPAFQQLHEADGLPGYLIWTDDVGYADGLGYVIYPVSELVDDTGFTGKVMTDKASTSGLAYDYALTYLCLLGMLENTAYPAIAWGREESRLTCLRTMPIALQWGDHEIVDDIGWGTTAATACAQWAGASNAWDNLFGLLRPTPATGDIRSLDTTARHWAMDLGDLRVLAPDSVTRTSGGDGTTYPYSYATIHGSNQIDDILTAATSSHPFKLLAWAYSGERTWQALPVATPLKPSVYWDQGSLSLVQPTEWARLYFNDGQTPKSLMDLSGTNGATGIMVHAHGDSHRPRVVRHYGYKGGLTPEAGLKADWISIYHAASTRAVGAEDPDSHALVAGNFHAGMQMLYRHPSDREHPAADLDPVRDYTPSGLRIRVTGSRTPKELRTDLLQSQYGKEDVHTVKWSGRFRVGSNRPINYMARDEGMLA